MQVVFVNFDFICTAAASSDQMCHYRWAGEQTLKRGFHLICRVWTLSCNYMNVAVAHWFSHESFEPSHFGFYAIN